MKKMYMLLLMGLLISSLFAFKVSAESYCNYQEIVFDNDDAKLLKDYTKKDYSGGYKKIKRKFMGWRIEILYKNEELEFVSETKLKIYNDGFSTIKHDITLETSEETKMQLSASGGIKIGVNGNVKKFKGSIDADIKASVNYSTLKTNHEKYEFEIIVDPKTYVRIITRGKGEISSGVGKCYFFWVQTKQGGWETFTQTTEYYEIVKDRI